MTFAITSERRIEDPLVSSRYPFVRLSYRSLLSLASVIKGVRGTPSASRYPTELVGIQSQI